jgi:hypothetical protein
MGCAGRGQERKSVDPQPAGRLQYDQVVAQLQVRRGAARRQVRLQDVAHNVKHPVQVVGPILRAHIGPQLVDDVLAVQAMARCECQQLDEALGLAQGPFLLGDRPGSHGHAEIAQ